MIAIPRKTHPGFNLWVSGGTRAKAFTSALIDKPDNENCRTVRELGLGPIIKLDEDTPDVYIKHLKEYCNTHVSGGLDYRAAEILDDIPDSVCGWDKHKDKAGIKALRNVWNRTLTTQLRNSRAERCKLNSRNERTPTVQTNTIPLGMQSPGLPLLSKRVSVRCLVLVSFSDLFEI